MEFVIISIIALVILGIIAAIISRGEGGDDEVVKADGCAGCTEQNNCKLKSICDSKHTLLLIIAVLLMTTGCSTKKNTAQTRWWHSFNARYNTYYNGTLAYIDGSQEKENGNKDNFTEIIPLYTVGNKNSRQLGKANYERAIEKCKKAIQQHSIKKRPEWNKNRRKTEKDIEWLSRREYNPFLWKAWLLMGRSQFYSGNFDEAAATFSYISRLYKTQPAIYGKAKAWLAKTLIEQGYLYDAEDVIRNMKRDSIDWRAAKEWDYTLASYYIHSGDYETGVGYLQKVIKHEMRHKQKAREYYLLGQLEAALGHRDKAYKAFKHVIRLNPPYELEFNAQIAMTEVMAKGRSKQMISKLKRMAANDNNKDYQDQIYYAIGNIYLAQRDTTNAICAYEKGRKNATRNGIEKGVLLLHLGDLYWQKNMFSNARGCYGEAIGLLDKERKDYEQLSYRSRVLDELVPYTDIIHQQDSLQELSRMSEEDRNAVIDRAIEAYKKKEKEERRLQAQAEAEKNQNTGNTGSLGNNQNNRQPVNNRQSQVDQTWYFYNQMAVNKGKEMFQRQWGKRENADDWQRANKTVVAAQTEENTETVGQTEEFNDSIKQTEAAEDSLAQVGQKPEEDPHKREYYLAQIPFTEEQIDASNKAIADALCHAGIIFKDKLDLLELCEQHLRRLTDYYPDYEHMDDAYYHLFLLYSRMGQPETANTYIEKLKEQFPESQWTTILTDPYFTENARFGVHIEDSLYAATYDAFKAEKHQEVRGNAHISETRFPLGANRDKFIFINGLSKLNSGDASGCLQEMKAVVEKFPQSPLSEMAGMIINGVNAGKRLYGGRFDISDVWNHRSYVLNDSDTVAVHSLSAERNDKFVFMLVYQPDSVNENQLLYELAKFNFTSFLVRNFDLTIEDAEGLRRMQVTGFRNYDEVWQYAHLFAQQTAILQLLGKGRIVLISEPNLPLLGTKISYNEYSQFYDQHFMPIKVSTRPLLTEPLDVIVKDPEIQQDETDVETEYQEPDNSATEYMTEPEPANEQEKPAGTSVIEPEEKLPAKQQEEKKPVEKQPAEKKAEEKQQVEKKPEEKKQEEQKQDEPADDEYYDLEGF